jgi:K+-sensing histidine kinase KdpD
MDANQHSPAKQVLVYLAALTSPALALFLRLALERQVGELPHYVLLYPVVLLAAAMVGGAWAGLLATATSAVLASYWVLLRQFRFAVLDAWNLLPLAPHLHRLERKRSAP